MTTIAVRSGHSAAGKPCGHGATGQLVELHERDRSTSVVRTASDAALHVREATVEDLTAINDLHRRCSIPTLCSRYHAGRDRLGAAEWGRMVDPLLGHTLVLAEPAGFGSLIGFANVMRTTSDETAEVSLLLHDEWQGVGVGRAMTRHLVRFARRLGFADLIAWAEPDNRRAVSLLRGAGALADLREPGDVRWKLHLGAR
jgi:GNAT superfamily N-acetyltransferase